MAGTVLYTVVLGVAGLQQLHLLLTSLNKLFQSIREEIQILFLRPEQQHKIVVEAAKMYLVSF